MGGATGGFSGTVLDDIKFNLAVVYTPGSQLHPITDEGGTQVDKPALFSTRIIPVLSSLFVVLLAELFGDILIFVEVIFYIKDRRTPSPLFEDEKR